MKANGACKKGCTISIDALQLINQSEGVIFLFK